MTDEIESQGNELSAEAKDISCLFELCKEDFPFITSKQQTINIGKFLHVSKICILPPWIRLIYFQDLEKTGIRRSDKRLSEFMAELDKIMVEEGTAGRSLNNLNLTNEVFSKCLLTEA